MTLMTIMTINKQDLNLVCWNSFDFRVDLIYRIKHGNDVEWKSLGDYFEEYENQKSLSLGKFYN